MASHSKSFAEWHLIQGIIAFKKELQARSLINIRKDDIDKIMALINNKLEFFLFNEREAGLRV